MDTPVRSRSPEEPSIITAYWPVSWARVSQESSLKKIKGEPGPPTPQGPPSTITPKWIYWAKMCRLFLSLVFIAM